jgi:hypothetical protein
MKRSIALAGFMSVMVLVGFSPASASTLCKVNESPCAAGNQWPSHSIILMLSTKVKLIGNLLVSCHSHITTLEERTFFNLIQVRFKLFDWEVCEGCTSVTTPLLPDAQLAATGGGNGIISTTSSMELDMKGCSLGLACKAKVTNAKLVFSGGAIGSTATVKAEKVPMSMSGFGCGSTGTWNAGSEGTNPYVVTSVNGSTTGSVFVSAEP